MRHRRQRESGGDVHSTTIIASPPPSSFGNRIVDRDWRGVKSGWSNLIDECLDLEAEVDVRISRLMMVRERSLSVRREAERILLTLEDGDYYDG